MWVGCGIETFLCDMGKVGKDGGHCLFHTHTLHVKDGKLSLESVAVHILPYPVGC